MAQINYDCSPKTVGTVAKPVQPSTDLRDSPKRSLQSGPATPPPGSANDLAKAIQNNRVRAQQALDAAAKASNPAQLDKAMNSYDAAIKALDADYDKAADEASDAGRDKLLELKAKDEQTFADKAAETFQAQLDAAKAAEPQDPNNVGTKNGYTFVWDGPLQADHVTCREI